METQALNFLFSKEEFIMNKSTVMSLISLVLTLAASLISAEGQKAEISEAVTKEVAKALTKKG